MPRFSGDFPAEAGCPTEMKQGALQFGGELTALA